MVRLNYRQLLPDALSAMLGSNASPMKASAIHGFLTSSRSGAINGWNRLNVAFRTPVSDADKAAHQEAA